jgi:hypothetical protein
MKKWTNILAITLLLFNGLSALYGGLNLMLYPDGSGFGMPLSILAHTPFHNFLIPGIILFVANGLLSIVVCAALIGNVRHSWWLVMAQGAILVGWIVIQVILIQGVGFLHFLFGGIGVALIVAAWLRLFVSRNEQEKQKTKNQK